MFTALFVFQEDKFLIEIETTVKHSLHICDSMGVPWWKVLVEVHRAFKHMLSLSSHWKTSHLLIIFIKFGVDPKKMHEKVCHLWKHSNFLIGYPYVFAIFSISSRPWEKRSLARMYFFTASNSSWRVSNAFCCRPIELLYTIAKVQNLLPEFGNNHLLCQFYHIQIR